MGVQSLTSFHITCNLQVWFSSMCNLDNHLCYACLFIAVIPGGVTASSENGRSSSSLVLSMTNCKFLSIVVVQFCLAEL